MFSLRLVSQFYQQKYVPALTCVVRNLTTQARVHVKQGELEGSIEDLPSGKHYASFKGIPYARPPIGDLRFQAPLPPDKWIGLRQAKEHGGICPQFDMSTLSLVEGSEDCLFLNVYTPHTKGTNPLPVMVWFHGGAFFCGSGDSEIFGPEYLLEEEVVIVTVNYRLEVLGFLCLETKEVPGNAGMKDQVAALRWVKENISLFGGNPDNVTIFGESAGGCSATYHMVSPMSQGLGHKFIAQSGTFFHEWASAPNPKERAFRLGKYLGKETKDIGELLKYLRSVPAIQLAKTTKDTQTKDEETRGLPIRYVPTIEKIFEGQECFMPKCPIEILKERSFKMSPFIVGYNNKESIFAVKDVLRKRDLINKHFECRVPRKIFENVSKEQLSIIATQMKDFYFGDKGINKDDEYAIIDMDSDYNFSMDSQRFAKALAEVSSAPVFFYRFHVDSELNLIKFSINGMKYKGAAHADDIFYLFKTGFEPEPESKAWQAVKMMTKMWTNFAKYGNPTPAADDLLPVIWNPMTKDEHNFLQIDFDLQMGKDPDKERYDLWMKIHENVK